MTKQEALGFLRAHQPLPDDAALSESLIARYDEAREYFLRVPDAECIPYFLNSFGEIDGFGVYQMVDEVIRQFPAAQVVTHLATALTSPHLGVRYWCAQIASDFSVPELIAPLSSLLDDPDQGIRSMAILSLCLIKDSQTTALLEKALLSEKDKETRDLLRQSLRAQKPGNSSASP